MLADTDRWLPERGTKVDLTEVEETLYQMHLKFRFKRVCFDPWQAEHMAQRLQAGGLGSIARNESQANRVALPMQEVTPTMKNLQRIATAVIETFNDRRIKCYPEPNLKRDLKRLRIVERQTGFRLDSPRDEQGHGDTASAFGLALLGATEIAARRVIKVGAVEDRDHPINSMMSKFVRKAELHAELMKRLEEGGADLGGREGWEDIMARCGRFNPRSQAFIRNLY